MKSKPGKLSAADAANPMAVTDPDKTVQAAVSRPSPDRVAHMHNVIHQQALGAPGPAGAAHTAYSASAISSRVLSASAHTQAPTPAQLGRSRHPYYHAVPTAPSHAAQAPVTAYPHTVSTVTYQTEFVFAPTAAAVHDRTLCESSLLAASDATAALDPLLAVPMTM